MELTYTWVYVLAGLVTYDLISGYLGQPWRTLGAIAWPLTVALALLAGVLLLPFVVLAVIGHVISWYRRMGPWQLRPH